MPDITATDLKERLHESLERASIGHERLIVTEMGRQVAALVSLDDLGLIEAEEDRADAAAAAEALAEHRASGEPGIPLDQACRDAGG